MQFNLADLFEAVADEVPDREAVVCVDTAGGAVERLSYRDLDERATRLAHVLAGAGVGPGDHVALQLHNGNELLEGLLAAYKLRAAAVNVNYRYGATELRQLLADSDAVAVIHEPEHAGAISDAVAGLSALRHVLPRGPVYEDALAAASPVRDFPPRSADDRYLLYTGGTTGSPRGVMWRHEDIFFAALGGADPAGTAIRQPSDVPAAARGGGTRCLPASPLVHGSAQWMALATLYRGGTVVLTRARTLDPAHLWTVAAAERVSFLVIVGDAFARPLVEALETQPGRWELSRLTVILSGGATLSRRAKQDLLRLLPAAMVVDGFGASETGGQGQMVTTAADTDDSDSARFVVNGETAVLDDDLRPLTPGDGRVGWLARRGHIPLGYYNDQRTTARTFPVVDGVRWAVPGDRASVEADGTVVVHGRGSASINSGGEKIHAEEVERVLKAHPDVFDAVVVGVPDPRWGERVCAVVRPAAGARPTLAGLAEHCHRRLARYKAPRALVLVDEVERQPSGKADYRWAREVALRQTTPFCEDLPPS